MIPAVRNLLGQIDDADYRGMLDAESRGLRYVARPGWSNRWYVVARLIATVVGAAVIVLAFLLLISLFIIGGRPL